MEVSEIVHIKCAVCPEYFLCAECFAEGKVSKDHTKSHSYYIIVFPSLPSSILSFFLSLMKNGPSGFVGFSNY